MYAHGCVRSVREAYVVLSCFVDDLFEALGESVEIVRASLPDAVDLRSGLFAQDLATPAGAVNDTALLGELVEVNLLDMNLRADVVPLPIRRQFQAGECPGFEFFLSVFS